MTDREELAAMLERVRHHWIQGRNNHKDSPCLCIRITEADRDLIVKALREKPDAIDTPKSGEA